jgi:hypothetical protein
VERWFCVYVSNALLQLHCQPVDVAPAPIFAGFSEVMIGCPIALKCLVACLFLESSQQPTWPQVRHRRRCTHVSRSSGILAAATIRLIRLYQIEVTATRRHGLPPAHPRPGQRPGASPLRPDSNRNQTRRSVSSIQTSRRLAVAISPCSSHNPVSRSHARRQLLVVLTQFGQHILR